MQSIYHITLKKERKEKENRIQSMRLQNFFLLYTVNNIFSYMKYSNAISNIVIADNKEKCTYEC